MINEFLFMNGHGIYVIPAFVFTLFSFSILYFPRPGGTQKWFIDHFGSIWSDFGLFKFIWFCISLLWTHFLKNRKKWQKMTKIGHFKTSKKWKSAVKALKSILQVHFDICHVTYSSWPHTFFLWFWSIFAIFRADFHF